MSYCAAFPLRQGSCFERDAAPFRNGPVRHHADTFACLAAPPASGAAVPTSAAPCIHTLADALAGPVAAGPFSGTARFQAWRRPQL
eukprot:8986342-Alexandrium_andersonii.AAC.1